MTHDPELTPSDRRPQKTPRKPHRLSKAAVGIPLLAAAGWLGYKARQVPGDLPLPPALPGEHRDLASIAGRLAYYATGPEDGPDAPLLLVHSVNAAGSAFEVEPIYRIYGARRRVYALDLPGFGFSDRSDRPYLPRLMTDAILAMVEEIRRIHGAGSIDALALSLSCEFLARAAVERPECFRSLAFVSPTGFDRRGPRTGPPGSTRAMPALYNAFTVGLWRRPLFDLLTSRVSIRYFLEKTWGSKAIDEPLLDYDYLTTHQPGAEHAPYRFISGYLFSNDITRVYDTLALPIWMVHGRRGDFTDYSQTDHVRGRPNWTIDVLETGALPHFEMPDAFAARYDRFLAALP